MEDKDEEIPEIQTKQINGVEISNLEIAKIGMIYDYLVLDRFQEYCSFFRLEKCFGPFFPKEPHNFFPDVLKEICGPKRKYISYGRLILAYTKWKSKTSTNDNFNKFMDAVFNNIIETKDQNIGKIVEGGRIFSTRNSRGRKIISRFSIITDSSKNKINGFHIQYDDIFDTILSPDKTRDNITLEMNFPPNGRNIRDRDGISHIGGKYSVTKGIIKFLVFKCRSGKTFYIGDEKEEEGEEIKNFLYGTSSCQLKTVRIAVVDGNLIYLETKFQPSLRVNQKILDFDSIDENYINKNIINGPLIFEENEMQTIPDEELEKSNNLIIPCINDDAFIDKKDLEEPLSGKGFNEIYKSYLASEKELSEKEVEDLKNKIFEKTIMRKYLLRVFLRKFKVKENISILKTPKQPKTKISQDKFLAKIKTYKKKMDKIKEKHEELKKEESDNDSYWNDEEEKDWPKDDGIEIEEKKEIEIKKDEEDKKEIEIKKDDEDKKEIEIKKDDEDKKEIEINKDEEDKREIEIKKDDEEEKKEEEKNEIKVEIPMIQEEENKEGKIEIEINKGEKEEPLEQEKIVLKGKPKKLLKNKINNIKKAKEELKINKEENKEEDKKEEIVLNIEQKIEEPKNEVIKLSEPKEEEPKKDEIITEKKNIKKTIELEPKEEIIIEEDKDEKDKINPDKNKIATTTDKGEKETKDEIEKQRSKCFCNVF